MGKKKYPLWCLDRGDAHDEDRYVGPFDNAEAAGSAAAEHPDAKIRRCRRYQMGELPQIRTFMDGLAEQLDEAVLSGGPPAAAWANWEDAVVVEKADLSLAEVFDMYGDQLFDVRMYVCEEDE